MHGCEAGTMSISGGGVKERRRDEGGGRISAIASCLNPVTKLSVARSNQPKKTLRIIEANLPHSGAQERHVAR